jgi:hypothetical protein
VGDSNFVAIPEIGPVKIGRPRTKVFPDWETRQQSDMQAYHRMWKHGVTPDVYNAMFATQNGLCAICGKTETHRSRTGKVNPLSIDHDHLTGKVRALLCDTCNRALGFYEKREFGIHSYLAKWR